MILCIQFGWDPDSRYDQVESTKGNISDACWKAACRIHSVSLIFGPTMRFDANVRDLAYGFLAQSQDETSVY
jgi:hypothetical protein